MRRAGAEGDCAGEKSRILNPKGVGHALSHGPVPNFAAAGEGDSRVRPVGAEGAELQLLTLLKQLSAPGDTGQVT